jgi:FemAB-related protein (PEP-CTERM system-associated)
MSGLQVSELTDAQVPQWETFIEQCPGASFFHRAGWKQVIEEVYGHQSWFLHAHGDHGIEGVVCLAHVKSRLFGDALVSLPFCVYGGIAAQSTAARELLTQEAVQLARSKRVDYLELRNLETANPEWPSKDLYVTFRKELHADPEQNMQEIPRKQRAMVRKGIQAGLISQPDDDIEQFYRAYSESVRNLGTPVFPKRYFARLKEVFGDDCEVLSITQDGRLVASVMSFFFRDQVLPYYGGGVSHARRVKGNDFMYWEVMRRAAERGVRLFDYGRSKVGTGSYSFKKNWGFTATPLSYEYLLVGAEQVPDINPLNPKYRFFVNAWKRLPLPVANTIGPLLARSLG